MKKAVIAILISCTALFAQKAQLVEVISENMIKVKQNGSTHNIQLSGIELFSKANHATQEVGLEKKEGLKRLTLAYVKDILGDSKEIKYHVLYNDKGVQKVWLANEELNYKMVRDGYALVDTADPYLPTMLKSRMTIAMKYAKEKKLGLWGAKPLQMAALVDNNKHMCGWNNGMMVKGITKESILKRQEESLPKAARIINLDKLYAMRNRPAL